MIAFAKLDKNMVICTKENRVYKVKKQDIIDNKITVRNLKVINGKLYGKQFDFDRLPEFKDGTNKTTVIKIKLTSDGQAIIGYYCINSSGKILYIPKDDLYTIRKLRILNGKLEKDNFIITNIQDIPSEKAFKAISYSSDEYCDLYNKYKNNNLLTNDNKKVSSTIEAFGRVQEYCASPFENFMNFHKQTYELLSKANILKLVKIYNNSRVNSDGTIDRCENSNYFYVVTFKIKGRTKSLIVPKWDTKIVKLLTYRYGKLNKVRISDISNLIIDNESCESTISAKTILEQECLDVDDIQDKLNKVKDIEIKLGKVKLDEQEFKIRRNILLGSSDFRLMLAA